MPKVKKATELHKAIISGNVKKARKLLEEGAQVNCWFEGGEGEKEIHLAAQTGEPEIVKMLLNHGAAFNSKTSGFSTALGIAKDVCAGNGHDEIIEILECANKLLSAVERCDMSKLETSFDELQEMGVDPSLLRVLPSKKDPTKTRSLLDVAIEGGNPGIIGFLQFKCTNQLTTHEIMYNKYDGDEKNSLLHLVAKVGDTKKIEELVDRGALIDQGNNNAKTALMLAAQNGHEEAYDLLIELGARTDFVDLDGKTAADLMEEYKNSKSVISPSSDPKARVIDPLKDSGAEMEEFMHW